MSCELFHSVYCMSSMFNLLPTQSSDYSIFGVSKASGSLLIEAPWLYVSVSFTFGGMGRNGRVDHVPMLHDEGDQSNLEGIELSRTSSSQEYSLKIGPDENDIADLYGHSGATVASKQRNPFDNRKHEHLLKSGPLGKCDDPFCTTCPSYFGTVSRSDHVRPSSFCV